MPAFHNPKNDPKKNDKSGDSSGGHTENGSKPSKPDQGEDNHTETSTPTEATKPDSTNKGGDGGGPGGFFGGGFGGSDNHKPSLTKAKSTPTPTLTPAPTQTLPPMTGGDSNAAAQYESSLDTHTGASVTSPTENPPDPHDFTRPTEPLHAKNGDTETTDKSSKPHHHRTTTTSTESTSTTISEDSSTATSQAYSETIIITSIFTPGPTTSLESTSLPIQTSTGIEADTYSIDSTATYTPTSTSTSSTPPDIAGTNSHATSNGTTLPTYAIPLIVLAALITLAFLTALAVFGLKERRRKQQFLNGQHTPEPGSGGASSETAGKKPSYLRAVGKAAGLATGISGILWLAKKLSGRSEEEKRKREYLEGVVAYAKLGGNRDEHESDSEKEMEVEVGSKGGGQTIERGRGRERERGLDAASQRSESMVVMNAALGYTPAPAPALISVTSPLRRSPSMVSSLSSSTRSQGQYERLIPSPVTDEAPYVWSPPPVPAVPSNIQGGGLGNTGSGTGDRRRSLVPAVLRPGGS
ncbi:hypothetical protein F4806DRAFT_433184 [Annulohypoxylon nitens]|nr:hypothetical protein F4806DRAFT_433184 [Annulohypoxylon nitens]